jgi:hypothetical protein
MWSFYALQNNYLYNIFARPHVLQSDFGELKTASSVQDFHKGMFIGYDKIE